MSWNKIIICKIPQLILLSEQITALKANDEFFIKSLYDLHFDNIRQFVLKNSGTEEDAKDIYQETFIAIWRNVQLDKFHPKKETSLGGYIYQVAKNKWFDHLRAIKNQKKRIDIEKIDDPVEKQTQIDDTLEHIGIIKINYRLLSEKCKEILNLFYFNKESMKQIADRFDWTEASAKNNKYRCLQKLREMITKK